MPNYYVFNKIDPHCYTMDVVTDPEAVDVYRNDPDYTVMLTTGGALHFINLWPDRFEPQASAEYRSFLEQVKEAEEAEESGADAVAAEAKPKAEQAGDAEEPEQIVLSADASEVMRDGLKAAANRITAELDKELSVRLETSSDARKLVNRLEAYRLALLSLAGAWETAEIDAACRED